METKGLAHHPFEPVAIMGLAKMPRDGEPQFRTLVSGELDEQIPAHTFLTLGRDLAELRGGG